MKLDRYHVDVHCPPWSREAILTFSESLKNQKLKYSFHARNKIRNLPRKQRSVVKLLVKNLNLFDELFLDYVFEFYANKNNIVKKVCYRIPLMELEYDVIFVISSTGKIVTIYINNRDDKHAFLDESIYMKEKKDET